MDNNLITSFKESDCDDTSKLYTKKCNTLLLKKEETTYKKTQMKMIHYTLRLMIPCSM